MDTHKKMKVQILRPKTNKSVWYGQFLEVPGTIFSKKSFAKLDFLKAVPVIMKANSKKKKMKKSYPILVSHTDFLKKFLPLTNFLETLSSPLNKEWEGVEN